MDKPEEKAYKQGQRAAGNAISHGVPRFIVMQGMDEERIDSRTGLPLAVVSAPPELAEWQDTFVRGFNDEILRAVESGNVTRDFRPLLMTRHEVKEAFSDNLLGSLSLDRRQLEDPDGRFVLHVQVPRPRKNSQASAWIVLDQPLGERNRKLLVYEAPVVVALGRTGKVVLIKTDRFYLAFDEETTQILHRYRIRRKLWR